jgi:site-specific recombinase XerD
VKTAWTLALARVHITDFHFHDLRHTFASTLVTHGVDLRSVETLLRRRDIAMTLRYSHLNPDQLRAAAPTLEDPNVRAKTRGRS